MRLRDTEKKKGAVLRIDGTGSEKERRQALRRERTSSDRRNLRKMSQRRMSQRRDKNESEEKSIGRKRGVESKLKGD